MDVTNFIWIIIACSVFLVAVYLGLIPFKKKKARKYDSEGLSTVLCYSPIYGLNFVKGMNQEGEKTIMYLEGIEEGITDIEPFENYFPLDIGGIVTGDASRQLWVHIPSNYTFKDVFEKIGIKLNDRTQRLVLENMSLKNQNRKLRENAWKEIITDADKFGEIKEKLKLNVFMGGKGMRPSYEEGME